MEHLNRTIQMAEMAVLGAASKLAPGAYLKKAVRRAWAQKMVGLRGVPLKFSQILSITRKDDNAQIHQEALVELEPLPVEKIETYLKEQASTLWDQIDSLQEVGIPASLGQVHHIFFRNGNDYALKIKYPDIERNMDLDTTLLGLMTKTFHHFKEGFALNDYQTVIQQELEGELDYRRELKFQQRFYQAFLHSNRVVIPQPIAAYSQDDHLLMTWESGEFLPSFLDTATPQEKQEASEAIVEFFMTSVFDLGVIHADPNLGNFAFRRSASGVKLVVYDFGSVVPLPQKHALILLKLCQLVEAHQGDPLPWLVELGFAQEPLIAIRSQLLAFFDLLLEPLLSQARYDLTQWNRKQRAEQILGAERWNFMVAAPASLLPFMRTLQGLFYYTRQLEQGIFIRPYLNRLLKQHAQALQALQAPEFEPYEISMAGHLKIQVIENDMTKVALTLPRHAVENLTDFMDEDVQQKLINQGISLDDIVKRCRANGYRPMDLFEYENGSKQIRVYML